MILRAVLVCCFAMGVFGQGTNEILLHAKTAIVHGNTLRYEPQTNKNTLGYWTNPNDWAEWKFNVEKPGVYDLEVWQGCGKGNGGSDVRVECAGQTFDFVVDETGHFQSFLPRKLGRIHFWKAGEFSLALKPQNKKAAAVMDVRQVKLIPLESPYLDFAKLFLGHRRVVFLGDSITYGGDYIDYLDAYLRIKRNGNNGEFDFINLGLPSETVSGLSEPGHAGGAFPRPDLHERLDRVLEKTKPDLIVACYGMNDGIYYPFAEERFSKFREGILKLRAKAEAAGAKVIHITPPTFDSVPLRGHTLPAGLAEYRQPYEGYNDVLDKYAEWLLSQRTNGWTVLDAHGPMNRFLAERRKTDPNFKLAGDGVHAGPQGNWIITAALRSENPDTLLHSYPEPTIVDSPHFALVQKRNRIRKDAWLTAIGHKRPGMNPGKSLDEAEAEADALAIQIAALCDPQYPGKRIAWNGFDSFELKTNDSTIRIALPKLPDAWGAWTRVEHLTDDLKGNLRAAGRGISLIEAPVNVSTQQIEGLCGSFNLGTAFESSQVKYLFGMTHEKPAVELRPTDMNLAQYAEYHSSPKDEHERPLIRKLGTVDLDLVETTPVVISNRLWRFEWVRDGYWNNQRKTNFFRLRDPKTGEFTDAFAEGHEFGSAFVNDGVVYVSGTHGRGEINIFASRDLKNWEKWNAIPAGKYGIFNTSICKAGNEFVLMFEIDKPVEEAGVAFTARFAKSKDLRAWTMTPPECNYAKDRYTAPHCLRWLDGWFYDFYLEAHDGYEMRVVRSRDLIKWEPSPKNPVLKASPEDKRIAAPNMPDPQRARVANANNINNSDIDFCEFEGQLRITYSWGNQLGVEHLAEAVYDGSEAEFLRGWFPNGD